MLLENVPERKMKLLKIDFVENDEVHKWLPMLSFDSTLEGLVIEFRSERIKSNFLPPVLECINNNPNNIIFYFLCYNTCKTQIQ